MWKEIVCNFILFKNFSGIAGCCAKTTVAPLDRVKVLLQAHNHHYKHLGELMDVKDKKWMKTLSIYWVGFHLWISGKRTQKGIQVWEQILHEIYLLPTLNFSLAISGYIYYQFKGTDIL